MTHTIEEIKQRLSQEGYTIKHKVVPDFVDMLIINRVDSPEACLNTEDILHVPFETILIMIEESMKRNEIIRVKEDIADSIFQNLGYNFVLMEGAYVSSDKSTVIMTHRDGQTRKVVQYRPNREEDYDKHVQELRDNNLLE